MNWILRGDPLTPVAVAGLGPVASLLGQRLLERDDDSLSQMSAVAGSRTLVVLSATDQLPWADGVVYLGHPPECYELFTPTTLSPSVSASLVDAALRRQWKISGGLAVLPEQKMVIPLENARPVFRPRLLEWLESERHASS